MEYFLLVFWCVFFLIIEDCFNLLLLKFVLVVVEVIRDDWIVYVFGKFFIVCFGDMC